MDRPQTVAIAFAGGLGLAAYHAGVFEAFCNRDLPLHWVSGSSAGAVTAALIAGNAPESRVGKLRAFWQFPSASGVPEFGQLRHLYGWLAAIETRLGGRLGFFHPRMFALNPFRFRSFYDLTPMKERLLSLVDFGRLNSGEPRLSVAATDIESGEVVIFDSSSTRLEIDHLLASCGFLPEFAPVQLGDRWLGDGGLSLNVPFDPILEESAGSLRLYVVDLYPRDGERPRSLEAALERKNDLLFANQTFIRLSYLARARAAERQSNGSDVPQEEIFLLSYRPGIEEPGPEKSFELSAMSFAQRWQAGRLDMEHALALPACAGISIVRRSPRGEDTEKRPSGRVA
ncbi:MAG TPA: patatin-like phospholipase family protein [Bradyrhizobium sp.]|uniref:patatin-like phospholipase family protein n=1 Tax=Bradyrhizobium sp. TaxID=376 RepID=UPI002D803219|nr:patatin-like phospholipase family protein [Bradyrhizobium sp.]HET7889004.1 patatin-like phospholipase family protein [Bradyrhizobium sp.]